MIASEVTVADPYPIKILLIHQSLAWCRDMTIPILNARRHELDD
jgi:hypothetical protein